MMLQKVDKKIKIYFYLFIFLLLSSPFNFNFLKNLEKKFQINNIDIQGDLLNLKEINNQLNKNIFFLDNTELKEITENYFILKKFEIKKIYPNKLKVKFEKAKPLAKILKDNNLYYLGNNGKIYSSNENYKSIPYITGDYSLENLNKLIKIIYDSPFEISEINTIKIYPSKRFDLRFKNKKVIQFPIVVDENIMNNAFNFYDIKDKNIKIIDMRLEKKIILKNE
tara:strand:- start:191 stop:862 length:672 start_codon:yes stop_codon:yes gene_type:complete